MTRQWSEWRRYCVKWREVLRHGYCRECGVKLQEVDNLESALCCACEKKQEVK